MRNLWILTRFLLKSGPGKSNQKSGKKKAFSDGGRIVVYLLLGVCLLPVSVLLFLLGYSGVENVNAEVNVVRVYSEFRFRCAVTVFCVDLFRSASADRKSVV